MFAAHGIFGGTFDPIHIGHLRSALDVKAALKLDKLYLTPCRIPPHRAHPCGTAEHRLEMIKCAIEGSDLDVDGRELERDALSYSIDTLSAVRESIGSDISLSFIIGLDAFLEFDTWHRWQDIFTFSHLVVLTRPGFTMTSITNPALTELLRERYTDDSRAIKTAIAGNIVALTLTQLDIAASKIRAMIANGESIRYLVPDRVVDYIVEHGLYR